MNTAPAIDPIDACPYCGNTWPPGIYTRCPACNDQEPPDCKDDPVNHPPHYTAHPSGVECIQITEHMNFCVGNAIKYLWRCELKGKCVEDLEKARFYIDQEIKRRKRLA